MRTTINIPKRASGAKKDQIGDGTLFYTGEVSDFNKSLSGWFIDNPPVLSQKHASLVWRYNHGLDRYILIHVQGSQVVSESMGRYYPFRAGYEVSRDDMNKIGFSLTSLFAALPRIATMTYGRVDLETVVEEKRIMPAGPNSSTLAHNIMAAIVTGKRLMVEITPKGDGSWREDGIFKCLEMDTVLSAIDNMDIKLRRYATFAFCVDENFEPVLDGVPVVFYRAGCSVKPGENDLPMTWQEVVSRRISLSPQQSSLATVFPYPGANEPLMTAEDMLKAYSVFNKDVSKLKDNEWDTWLKMGHKLAEVAPANWQQFKTYYGSMNGAVKKQFAMLYHAASLKWDIDGLTQELFSAVNNAQPYDDKERLMLQRRALQEYLENDKFGFLFADGVPDDMLDGLNAKYLESLNLNSIGSVERWYGIYKKHKRLKEPGVTEAFASLLKTHASQLTDIKQIVAFMARYPFVPVEAYRKPATIKSIPSTRELEDNQAKLVKKWIADASKGVSFKNLGEVIDLLTTIKLGDDYDQMKAESLKNMDRSTLMSLLAGVREASQVDRIESLLEKSEGLAKYWSDFKDMVKPAVNEFLFGQNGKWKPSFMLDVKNWDKLAAVEEHAPKVFALIEEAFVGDLENAGSDQVKALVAPVTNYYTPLEDGSGGHEPNRLVESFLECLKKIDNEKAIELENIMKLSRSGGIKSLLLGALLGLVLGGALGFLGYKMMYQSDGNAPTASESSYIVKFLPREKQNMMLMLAALPDSINEVYMDSLTLSMDSVRKDLHFLQAWNKMSLQSLEQMDSARLSISPLSDVEEFQPDVPRVISKKCSLYDMMTARVFKVDSITVLGKGVTFAIPSDSLLGGQTVTALPADYYFKVINYIDTHLPKDKIINLPY